MDEPDALAVMFADVSGSTELYESLGDTTASMVIAEAVDRMARAVGRHGGIVIKTIGDEVMARFSTVTDAAQGAIAIEEAMRAPLPAGPRLSVRVGLHFGQAIIRDDGDVFGDAVNVAARMVGLARAGQIVMSGASVALLPGGGPVRVRLVDRATVKGKKEPLDIYQVLWDDDTDATRIVSLGRSAPGEAGKVLQLLFHGHAASVSERDTPFLLGRGPNSDLVVDLPLVSRKHARIEYRRGAFVLEDQSTNGTYVVTHEGARVHLRRDECPLLGSGQISLGAQDAQHGADSISYTVLAG
ncbi:adenylate/guanylate cyclase domain-containing protein [Lolliginicoccus suaedae]|uniref:adenylate/guanylate cyclase domain-containing protein n=1 Tax=Lolliginicoccus suaedae TaxID=2605429 RepID=UPI0011EBC136|nr:adenylate/guanylate cyclase domain-containing protein [Lolliginicoccus suaedae]